MLSAEEIIAKSKKESKLPESGGQKFFVNNGSDLQQESICHALEEFSKFLHEERIVKKSSLTVAHWCEEKKKALVEILKGHIGERFGYQSKDGIFLDPEECLFLIDQGVLELKYDGSTLSFQEAFILILPNLPSIEYYQVYSYLCKLGFKLKKFKDEKQEFPHDIAMLADIESMDIEEISPSSPNNNDDDDDLEVLKSGFLQSLWEGEAVDLPLVRPSEAKSTAAILSKLQIIKATKANELLDNASSQQTGQPTEQTIHFDVYISKQMKQCEQPNFRIIVCRYCDPPPSLYDMVMLTKKSDGVHFKFAVVNHGTVSFYGMFDTDLPTIISCG